MKTARLLSMIVLALLIAMPATAQEKQGKKKRPVAQISTTSQALMRMMRLHDAVETLKLSDEEGEKLGKVLAKIGPKMKELMEKLGEVVTDEQEAAAKEAGEKAKAENKKGRQFFVAVEAAIQLTDEQKKKLDVIGKEMLALHRKSMKEVLGALSEEQQEKLKKAMMPKTKKEKPQDGKKKAE